MGYTDPSGLEGNDNNPVFNVLSIPKGSPNRFADIVSPVSQGSSPSKELYELFPPGRPREQIKDIVRADIPVPTIGFFESGRDVISQIQSFPDTRNAFGNFAIQSLLFTANFFRGIANIPLTELNVFNDEVYQPANNALINSPLHINLDDMGMATMGGMTAIDSLLLGSGMNQFKSVMGARIGSIGAAEKVAEELPEVVFDYAKHPELAENIWNAQKAGHPSVLTYGGDTVADANRAASLKDVPNIRPFSRDEYPFASTFEGGANAWVGHVPVYQQSAQGNILMRFYDKYNIQLGDQFRVGVINIPK